MITFSEKPSHIFHFPDIPHNLKTKYPSGELSLRGFGMYRQDLEVNFNQFFYPCTVTEVLQCCTIANSTKPIDTTFFWELPVGTRIECLLAILSLSNVHDSSLDVVCLNPDCQKNIELELSLTDLLEKLHKVTLVDHINVPINDKEIILRKPNGQDQLEFMSMKNMDKNSNIKKILRNLIIDYGRLTLNEISDLSEESITSIDTRMSKVDPLIDFSVSIECPHCGKWDKHDLHLEKYALGKLKELQDNLMLCAHKLARNYHWTERQIFTLPGWRRSQYLSFIEKERDGIV